MVDYSLSAIEVEHEGDPLTYRPVRDVTTQSANETTNDASANFQDATNFFLLTTPSNTPEKATSDMPLVATTNGETPSTSTAESKAVTGKPIVTDSETTVILEITTATSVVTDISTDTEGLSTSTDSIVATTNTPKMPDVAVTTLDVDSTAETTIDSTSIGESTAGVTANPATKPPSDITTSLLKETVSIQLTTSESDATTTGKSTFETTLFDDVTTDSQFVVTKDDFVNVQTTSAADSIVTTDGQQLTTDESTIQPTIIVNTKAEVTSDAFCVLFSHLALLTQRPMNY